MKVLPSYFVNVRVVGPRWMSARVDIHPAGRIVFATYINTWFFAYNIWSKGVRWRLVGVEVKRRQCRGGGDGGGGTPPVQFWCPSAVRVMGLATCFDAVLVDFRSDRARERERREAAGGLSSGDVACARGELLCAEGGPY